MGEGVTMNPHTYTLHCGKWKLFKQINSNIWLKYGYHNAIQDIHHISYLQYLSRDWSWYVCVRKIELFPGRWADLLQTWRIEMSNTGQCLFFFYDLHPKVKVIANSKGKNTFFVLFWSYLSNSNGGKKIISYRNRNRRAGEWRVHVLWRSWRAGGRSMREAIVIENAVIYTIPKAS